MTTKEMADKYNVSEVTVKKWCEQGCIRGTTIDTSTGVFIIPKRVEVPYTQNRSKGDGIYTRLTSGLNHSVVILYEIFKVHRSIGVCITYF